MQGLSVQMRHFFSRVVLHNNDEKTKPEISSNWISGLSLNSTKQALSFICIIPDSTIV